MPEVGLSSLAGIQDAISGDFPERRDIRQLEVGITGGTDKDRAEAHTDDRVTGYVFKSKDQSRLVQCRLDGFTFNQLSPYPSWEELKGIAVPMWERYRAAAKPQLITRLALRYINVLQIPAGEPFDSVLAAPPSVPNELPRAVASFVSRVTVTDASIDCFANIIQSFEGFSEPGKGSSVTLDIDVYKTVEYDSTNENLPAHFEQLHGFKNRVFFSSITEDAVRTYE
jgi:uncharacterized protein (TIGR04255 family)